MQRCWTGLSFAAWRVKLASPAPKHSPSALPVVGSLTSSFPPDEIDAVRLQRRYSRDGKHSGVWRYQPLLPVLPGSALVSRWEGNTPLYRDDRLARYAGLPDGHLE